MLDRIIIPDEKLYRISANDFFGMQLTLAKIQESFDSKKLKEDADEIKLLRKKINPFSDMFDTKNLEDINKVRDIVNEITNLILKHYHTGKLTLSDENLLRLLDYLRITEYDLGETQAKISQSSPIDAPDTSNYDDLNLGDLILINRALIGIANTYRIQSDNAEKLSELIERINHFHHSQNNQDEKIIKSSLKEIVEVLIQDYKNGALPSPNLYLNKILKILNLENLDFKIDEVKTTHKMTKTQTSSGSVQKTYLPYLDWHINPDHLYFDEDDPAHSPIKINTFDKAKNRYVLYPDATLGEGMFGAVYLAQDELTGEFIAIKAPKHDGGPELEGEALKREINNCKKEADKLKENNQLLFCDERSRIIGMKLIEGHQLFNALVGKNKSPQNLSLLQKLVIAKNILKNIAHLINKNTLHSDIKSENISLNLETNATKFYDFGLARTLDKTIDKKSTQSDTYIIPDKILKFLQQINIELKKSYKRDEVKFTSGAVQDDLQGDVNYMAPELLKQFSQDPNQKITYNELSEIYSLGLVLNELFGEDLLDNTNEPINSILNHLIELMISDKPEERPSVILVAKVLNWIFSEAGRSCKLDACVISIDDFLSLDEEQKQTFIRTIIDKKINAIALQASDKTEIKDYYSVKHELIKHKIICFAPFMASSESQEAIYRVVKDHYDQTHATVNTRVFQYDCLKQEMIEKTDAALKVKVSTRNTPVKLTEASSSILFQTGNQNHQSNPSQEKTPKNKPST